MQTMDGVETDVAAVMSAQRWAFSLSFLFFLSWTNQNLQKGLTVLFSMIQEGWHIIVHSDSCIHMHIQLTPTLSRDEEGFSCCIELVGLTSSPPLPPPGKLTAYDTDGDGDFDVEDAKVLLGKSAFILLFAARCSACLMWFTDVWQCLGFRDQPVKHKLSLKLKHHREPQSSGLTRSQQRDCKDQWDAQR